MGNILSLLHKREAAGSADSAVRATSKLFAIGSDVSFRHSVTQAEISPKTDENFSPTEFSSQENFQSPKNPKIPQPCPTCLSPLYWQSAYARWEPNHLADLSGLMCVECDPPPAESLVRRRVLVAIEQPHYVEVDRRMRLLSVLEIVGGGFGGSRGSGAAGSGSPTNLDASSPSLTPFSNQAVCVELHLPNQRRIEGDQTFSDPREPLRIWTTKPGRYQVDKYSRIAAEDLAMILSFPDFPDLEISTGKENPQNIHPPRNVS